jgi:hypothetical protein
MNDKDKGTYSPPTEDNLSYETRKSPKRDQAPITLIISGICLVLLLLAVVLFYNSGLNTHGRAAPDVGDTVGDIKDKVEDAKPLTDQDINDTTNGDAASAHFAPDAETPGARADASIAAVDQAPPVAAPIQGPLPSQANNAAIPGTAAANASASGAKSSSSLALRGALPSTDNAPAAPPAKPVQQVAAAKPPVKPDAAPEKASDKTAAKPVSGNATVQIGAFESQDIANKQYASITSSYGIFLGNGVGKRIEKVDTDKGTRFRALVTGFDSTQKAKEFCSALKSAGHDCFIK